MATILAYLNPLIGFLYWGGIVLALGTADRHLAGAAARRASRPTRRAPGARGSAQS